MKTLQVLLFLLFLSCFAPNVYADDNTNGSYDIYFGCYNDKMFVSICEEEGLPFAIKIINNTISDPNEFKNITLRYSLFFDENTNCIEDAEETITDALSFEQTTSVSGVKAGKSEKHSRTLFFPEKKYNSNKTVRFSAKVCLSNNNNCSGRKPFKTILNQCSLLSTLYGVLINQIEIIANSYDRGPDGIDNMIAFAPYLKPAIYILNMKSEEIESEIFKCDDCIINRPSISTDNKTIAVEYENNKGNFIALIDIESRRMEIVSNSDDGIRPFFISENKLMYFKYKLAQSNNLTIEGKYDTLIYNRINKETEIIAEFDNTNGIPISAHEENGGIMVFFVIHKNHTLEIYKKHYLLSGDKTETMECAHCKDSLIREKYYSNQLKVFLFLLWVEDHLTIVKAHESNPDNKEQLNIFISPYSSFCLFKKEEDFKAVFIDFSVYQERNNN